MRYSIVDKIAGNRLWTGKNPADKASLTAQGHPTIDSAPPANLGKFPKWNFATQIWEQDVAAQQAYDADQQSVDQNRTQGKQAYKDFKQLVNSAPTWDQANLQTAMELIRKSLRGFAVREGNG